MKNSIIPESNNLEDFFVRLQRYPLLQIRVEAILDVVENSSGDVVKADEAEHRVLEEIRRLGQQAIQVWADRKQQKMILEYDCRSDLSRKEKKTLLADPLGQD